jgi:selT/selW/selH-like putative selenoprotein
MEKQITIEYCVPCGFEKQAVQLSEEIKAQFGARISSVELKPTRLVGSFEVSIADELIYSKKKTGRLPHPGEVEQIIFARLTK